MQPKFTANSGFNVYLWVVGCMLKVLIAEGFSKPCLSRLERAESAVGWESSGSLCLALISSKRCWNSGQVFYTKRLAQHDLQVHEQVFNRTVPSYLFKPMIPNQTRRNSSRPDATLVTPHPTNPNRPPTSPSYRLL
eukprot:632042-Pelagomonas_calceolata.AAC.1